MTASSKQSLSPKASSSNLKLLVRKQLNFNRPFLLVGLTNYDCRVSSAQAITHS
eukprot:Gb_23763 [translate_table: standard]